MLLTIVSIDNNSDALSLSSSNTDNMLKEHISDDDNDSNTDEDLSFHSYKDKSAF